MKLHFKYLKINFKLITIYRLIAISLFISSCSPTWKLKDNEYLIINYKTKFKNKNHNKNNINKKDVLEVLYPKTNRKIFGFYRFYLQMYYLGDTKSLETNINKKKKKLYSKNKIKKDKYQLKKEKFEKKIEKKNLKKIAKGKDKINKSFKKFKPKLYKPTFNQWLTEVVGEKPVLLDSLILEKNKTQINNLLFTNGYFNSSNNFKIDTSKNKVKIDFIIEKKQPYRINKISYNIEDSSIKMQVNKLKNKSVIKKGAFYNKEKFDKEREIISSFLKNKGYYKFDKNYITYNVDSTLKDHTLDVEIKINNFRYSKDSISKTHPIYRVNKINIYVDCKKTDSTIQEVITKDKFNTYNIFYRKQLKYKPKLLMNKVFINSTKNFNYKNIVDTYRTLNALGVFKRIEIIPVEEDSNMLKVDIILESTKKNNYSIETNGTFRDGGLGANASITLNNNNLFKGAEQLKFRFSAGIEAQRTITESEDDLNDNTLSPNTIEYSPELSLIFPRFILPFKLNNFKKQIAPKTSITFLYNFQDRSDYKRALTSGYISYQWNQNKHFKHQLSPLNVSFIKIDKSSSFNDFLETIDDPLIISSYQDNFIPSLSYSLYFLSNESYKEKRHNWYNYFNIELAGTLLTNLGNSLNLKTDSSGNYLLNSIPIANYFKINNDIRYHFNADEKNKLAFRFFAGYAQPLKNSNVIPFEKAFTAGGANDIRAWQARTLGPGAYTDTVRKFDKLGDIKLELNAEYRFKLIDLIEGALFVDAGNIWLVKKQNEDRSNAIFNINTFYDQVAIGGGLGIRMNLTVFILRFDAAIQTYDPSLTKGERWVWQKKEDYNNMIEEYNSNNPNSNLDNYRPKINLNIGIGYPF